MKEELTTKMHSELTISDTDDLKFRVFSVLTLVNGVIEKTKKYLNAYEITFKDVQKYIGFWVKLSKD